MALARTIEHTALDDLYLDPKNPRLGRSNTGEHVPQARVLELMRSWRLEELAVSFLESGFWPQEAVIVVKEPLYGPPDKMVVVEGNRRIAAMTYLREAIDGNPASRGWARLIEGVMAPPDLFNDVPYILADDRSDVTAFLGFRHVTGIKEWEPAEKAEFIARLVDEQGLSYEEIRKQIGSRADTVRRNYIAFRILMQLEGLEQEVPTEGVENRFSVLFLSLREAGVQDFLGINIRAEPDEARTPIPAENTDDLADFVVWMFGDEDRKPLFTDSRYVTAFGRILASEEAVEYLRTTSEPSFDLALQKAGVEEEEIIQHVRNASDQIELALSRVHLHQDSDKVQGAVRRLALSARELIGKFPGAAMESGWSKSDGGDA